MIYAAGYNGRDAKWEIRLGRKSLMSTTTFDEAHMATRALVSARNLNRRMPRISIVSLEDGIKIYQ